MEIVGKLRIEAKDIADALEGLSSHVVHTPLMRNRNYCERYGAKVHFKREDLQEVRSYKIRGAFNKINSLTEVERNHGVVCASAGNHAQGVAYACHDLNIHGTIFMPTPTPSQKVNQVRNFGRDNVDVVLVGDTFDDAHAEAIKFQGEHGSAFIHPFDDEHVIIGQGTLAKEILDDFAESIDYLFLPIGGGGMASGVSTYFKEFSPKTKIIGIEPEGAAAMKASMEQGELVTLDHIDKFVDGAAVKRVGEITFEICKENLDDIITVPEGKVCSIILQLYNEDAIVVEPAGALSLAALDHFKEEIKGKTVVCVVSGGNNDITRTEEIKERSMLFEGLKHYFIVTFPQRAGALKEFLSEVLGPTDDIAHFEYTKKNSRERAPAVIGIELADPSDLAGLFDRLDQRNFTYEYLNNKPELLTYLV